MKNLKNKRAAKLWRKKRKKRGVSLSFRREFHKGVTKKRKPITRRAVFALLCILLLCALLYAALFSDFLRIKSVTVSGNENVTAGELEAMVRGELAEKKWGFIPGDNFIFVDEEKLETKIKESFTEIENINVGVKFPDRIVLELKEKNTALIWCRNSCYFVNDEGTAFLLADEGELIKEEKQFIKIIEEAKIAEESEEDRQTIIRETGDEAAVAEETEVRAEDGAGSSASVEDIEAQLEGGLSVLPAIILNEKVADAGFISFAVEIGRLLSHNARIQLKYFKTKGYKTRELIGFTDQNTRLYFDTTKSAEKQSKNLDYLLSDTIETDKVDLLQYVYLKNEDRVFYK